MIKHKEKYPRLFALSTAKLPNKKLYIVTDPACLVNLAGKPEYKKIQTELRDTLIKNLKEQKDPRVLGYADIFDCYPATAPCGTSRNFKERDKYNPKYEVK